MPMLKTKTWDFPGSAVARTAHLHSEGTVWSPVRELILQAQWPGQNKQTKKQNRNPRSWLSGVKRGMLCFNGHCKDLCNYPALNVHLRKWDLGSFSGKGGDFILELVRAKGPGDWHSLLLLPSFQHVTATRKVPRSRSVTRTQARVDARRALAFSMWSLCPGSWLRNSPCLRCHLCFDQWDHTISSSPQWCKG